MIFVSKLPQLKVVLQTPRRLMDVHSGNPGMTIPGQYAQFKMGRYETSDPSAIRIMVEKFYMNKSRGLLQTFWPHPSDESAVEKMWARMKEQPGMVDGLVMDKDDALRQALAENDRLRRERDTAMKGNRQRKMKAGIVELPEQEEKSNSTGEDTLSPDDVEDSESEE